MITSLTEPKKDNPPVKAAELSNIGKKYRIAKTVNPASVAFWALKDISFNIYKGRIFGVIGRNGAGKTTLLNIIAGTLSPTEGNLRLNSRVRGLFNLGVGFQDELTGRENIFLNGAILGAAKKEIESRLSAIIEFSEIINFIDMPMGSYSQGMRLRLGFSIVTNLDFDVLIIDEILAVGDALFQNKCYERLVSFKGRSKTLIITSQDLSMIERLCDEALLLDHGRILFQGKPKEAAGKYRALLNTEKFFVGLPRQKPVKLIEDTKKWADNISEWGNKFGTKEASIESVKFINGRGVEANKINVMDSLRVKVSFSVKSEVKNPHFGVAIFRNDGVYCYGPNTGFDGKLIPKLKQGKGYFFLDYQKLFLAPGEYRVSIAIWDEDEALAYDHHYGYYKLTITGYNNKQRELLCMPVKADANMVSKIICFITRKRKKIDVSRHLLTDKSDNIYDSGGAKIMYVRLLDAGGNRKDIFMTNERVEFSISLDYKEAAKKGLYLWLGIYRDDGVYCQGVTTWIGKRKECRIIFLKLPLLPGGYRISTGIWNAKEKQFLTYQHGIYSFRMVSDRADHGTIYLEHKWRIKFP
jgi:ABC-type polysaccharide/polyol phosphate transport system ATPase subunit